MELPTKPGSRLERYLGTLIHQENYTPPNNPSCITELYLQYIIDKGPAFLNKGYFYNGNFYKDEEHTELVEPEEDTLYFDRSNGYTYIWNGTSFELMGGGNRGEGRFLSSWNCTTGLPTTEPTTIPYEYKTGDYYIVSSVASSVSETNYKPNGSTYTGVASTTLFPVGEEPEVNDFIFYDTNKWILIENTNPKITIDAALSTISENPVQNKVITNRINELVTLINYIDRPVYIKDNTTDEFLKISAVNGVINIIRETDE